MKEQRSFSDDFPKIEVRTAIKKGIAQAESEWVNVKTNRRRKVVYTFASLAAAIILLIGSAHVSPTIASGLAQIPLIGSVFEQSEQKGLQLAKKHGLTNVVGETKTVDGISVTVDEILYDQNNISIGLFIESNEPLPEHYFGAGMDITINGKMPSYFAGDYGENSLSDTSLMAIQQILLTDEMPDAFELGLILTGEKGERWDFSVPIEKVKDVKKVLINHSQTLDNLEIFVDELMISPTGITLTYDSIETETDFQESLGGNVEFKITDQNGQEIPGITGGVMGELIDGKIYHTSNKQFDPIDESVTSLTITPYFDEWVEYGVEVDGDQTVKQFKRKSSSDLGIFESFTVDLQK